MHETTPVVGASGGGWIVPEIAARGRLHYWIGGDRERPTFVIPHPLDLSARVTGGVPNHNESSEDTP